MNPRLKPVLSTVLKVFFGLTSSVLFVLVWGGVYVVGYHHGSIAGQRLARDNYAGYVSFLVKNFSSVSPTPSPSQSITQIALPTAAPKSVGLIKEANWGGPIIWEIVNKRRQEFGVNPLNQEDNLCTIASIRLNELLELGNLDGHEGFSNMAERRPDLKPIFESYSTVAEFLAAGADSAQETVSLWENSLGHKKLMTGGEYVWGCIYAQNSFAVAITSF